MGKAKTSSGPAATIVRLTKECRVKSTAQLNNAEKSAETARKKLADRVGKVAEARSALRKLHESIGRGGFETEFDLLMAHDDIEKLEIDGNSIVVTTSTIVIRHNGTDYKIGRFRFSVDTTSRYADHLHFKNLTRQLRLGGGTFDHPHINGGNPCLGNHSSVMDKYLRDRRFSEFIVMCLRFLNTYYDASKRGGHNPYGYLITEWK